MSDFELEIQDAPEGTMRLQKFLARAGVASRRGSEDLIEAGRVSVNGVVVTEMGVKVTPGVDVIEVDGTPVTLLEQCVYIMLHKPLGYVTTMNDPQGRRTVAKLVPIGTYPSLFPVGRLDLDTSGLLLFTTDGELGHRLLHPRRKVTKRYRVEVDGYLLDREVRILREGITLDDGPCAPADVTIESAGKTSFATCVITEGRKRQVRRMFGAISHPVLKLHRDAFGEVELGDLPVGEWRTLTADEVTSLKEDAFGIDGEA